MTDYSRPLAWYQRDRSIWAMRSIATRLDQPDLHDQVERADAAAATEDDGLFLAAVSKFLESLAQSRR